MNELTITNDLGTNQITGNLVLGNGPSTKPLSHFGFRADSVRETEPVVVTFSAPDLDIEYTGPGFLNVTPSGFDGLYTAAVTTTAPDGTEVVFYLGSRWTGTELNTITLDEVAPA